MHDSQTLAVNLNLVHRMTADFAHVVIDLASATIENQVVDHVLEKAEDAVLRDIDALVHAARFDDGGWGRIVFDDREGARDEMLGCARFAVRRFHFLCHSERSEESRILFGFYHIREIWPLQAPLRVSSFRSK